MKALLIAPDLGERKVTEAAWEIQRSGLDVYPLTGTVTEEQLADHCVPERRYDVLIWLTHGGPDGVLLKGDLNTLMEPSERVWLSEEQVTAYVQAAGTVKLVVLAVCEGEQLAKNIAFRTQTTVIYSEGDLRVTTAYTALATLTRKLKSGTLEQAIEIADTLRMRWFPRTGTSLPVPLAEFLQHMTGMITDQVRELRERFDRKDEADEQRFRELEQRIDRGLNGLRSEVHSRYQGRLSRAQTVQYVMGFCLFATLVAILVPEVRAWLGLTLAADLLAAGILATISGYFLLTALGFSWKV